MGYKQTNNIIERAAERRDAIFKYENRKTYFSFGNLFSGAKKKNKRSEYFHSSFQQQ